jgi:hypothetical protein
VLAALAATGRQVIDAKGAVWAQDTIEDARATKLKGGAKAMLVKLLADYA